jgi:hypothetical protein
MTMSVEELITNFSDESGNFLWGVETVLKSVRPNCLWEVTLEKGEWTVSRWDNNWSEKEQRYLEPPTSEELKEEYKRQQAIAETIEYFNSKQ